MIPILEALSSNVSALPAVASVAQSLSGAGRFAATLAAAQAQSTTPQGRNIDGTGSDLSGSNGSTSEVAVNQAPGVANNFNVRAATSGTIQLRKPIGNSTSNSSLAVALAGAAFVNHLLPEPIPATVVPLAPGIPIATSPLSVASPQPNVSLPNLLQANELPANFSQTSVQQPAPGTFGVLQSSAPQFSPLQTGVLQSGPPQPDSPATSVSVTPSSQTPEFSATNVQPTLPVSDFNAAIFIASPLGSAPNSATSNSATLSSTLNSITPNSAAQTPAGYYGESASPDISAGAVTNLVSSAVPSSSSSTPSAEPSSLPVSVSGIFTATGVTAESVAQEIPVSRAAATADVTTPATASSLGLTNQSSSASWNGLQNNWGTAEPLVVAESTPPVAAGPSTQNQTVTVATPASNLLANAFPQSALQVSLPLSAEAEQPLQSNTSSNDTQAGPASDNSSTETEVGISTSGNNTEPIPGVPIASAPTSAAQTPNAALLKLAAHLLSSKAPVPVVAPQLANPPDGIGVRVGTARLGVPAATLTSAPTAGSDSGKALPIASQTPFSVFFSNNGPGAESAVSALPKIVTPVAASSIHLANSVAADTQGASAPQVTLLNGSSQNTAPQTPSLKDALSGTSSGNSQTAQTLRRETDSSVTGLAVASAQTAVTAIPAPPAPIGITASPVALAADSAAKPESLPTAAPESPVIVAPAPPPPTPPTAIPGPVQVAQMVNRVGQSEMRIGMNTAAFGTVDVRTVVHASDVGLVIGSEKGDLRGLMTNEMPGINNSLQQQNLRLNNVSFMQGFASSGNGNGSGGSFQQRSFAPQQSSSNSSLPEPVDDSVEAASAGTYGSSRGLSILA
jgi:hypothetical protein